MYYLLVNKCINYGNYIYNLCVCCVVKGSCSVCSYHTSEMMSHCPLVFKQQNYIDILIDGAQNQRLGSNFYFVSFLLWLFFLQSAVLFVLRLRIAFKWMVRAFSGYLSTDQLLLLWDRILGYDSLEVVAGEQHATLSSFWFFKISLFVSSILNKKNLKSNLHLCS